MMTLKEIRELLVLREWTREQLAERLELTRNTIDRWFCAKEDSQRHPSPDHVAKMTAWLSEARNHVRCLSAIRDARANGHARKRDAGREMAGSAK